MEYHFQYIIYSSVNKVACLKQKLQVITAQKKSALLWFQNLVGDYRNVLGKANTDERELLKDVYLPMKSTIIVYGGFIGKEFTQELKENNNVELITTTKKKMKKQTPKRIARLISSTRKKSKTTMSQLTLKIWH